jgi:hypothetical protein
METMSLKWQTLDHLGVNVMIAIFGDFRQFSAKSWRFS